MRSASEESGGSRVRHSCSRVCSWTAPVTVRCSLTHRPATEGGGRHRLRVTGQLGQLIGALKAFPAGAQVTVGVQRTVTVGQRCVQACRELVHQLQPPRRRTRISFARHGFNLFRT